MAYQSELKARGCLLKFIAMLLEFIYILLKFISMLLEFIYILLKFIDLNFPHVVAVNRENRKLMAKKWQDRGL